MSRRLRRDTAAIHARVEEGMDLIGRLGTREGYAAALVRMQAFYRAIEPRLRAACEGHVPAEYLDSRLPRLEGDLTRSDVVWQSAPDPAIPDSVRQWPNALGALYVLEGAALGGQVIARHLEKALGVHSEFFGSEGTAVGPRWRAFRELLDRFDADYEAILAGAVATFGAFERAVVPA